ncbi:MAG: hypothetical protein JW776_09320 [Candidatus Lokiarchaeota archaeon]|nr:hypothetical protein [Candidatus Lokiarchaeota archaeon]
MISAQNPNGLSSLSNCESIEVQLEEPTERGIRGYSIGIILMLGSSVLALLYLITSNQHSFY